MKNSIKALIFMLLAFVLIITGAASSLNQTVEDYIFHSPSGQSSAIKIIAIDDKALNEYGDFSEWDREIYARLIDKLCVSDTTRPAVIGFDILFSSERSEEGDRAFAEACAKHGNVVTAYSYVFDRELVTTNDGSITVNDMYITDIVKPYAQLEENTAQGFANALMNSDDGFIRSSFYSFGENGIAKPSFNAAVYEAYCRSQGTEATPAEDIFTFRFSGDIGDFEHISIADVLNGSVPAEAFSDCIVLVGAYASGMMDEYYVPVSRGAKMYGVEIHANAIEALLDGKFITRIPLWLDALIAALLAGLTAFICSRHNLSRIIIICICAAAARIAVGFVLFGFGISGDAVVFPAIALIVMIYHIVEHYYIASVSKRKIENAFKKYVAPQIVSKIAKSGGYELKLGGENRDISVLFVDIRGFTPLSESLAPEQVVDILNSYLKLTTQCIFRHGGTLDKFVGDATMAIFNAPFDTEDYIYKSVLTAWDIVEGGRKIEKQFVERYGKNVGFGVGVNCGPAVVGNIGCDFRMDYTAIGDTVNTAARLEANAPRSTVYISGAVYEQIKDRITAEPVGAIPLKGKSNEVFVYSVTGINGYTSPEAESFTTAEKEHAI